MAEASLGESATVAATGGAAGAGASQSTPFETARAARARLVLAGSSGAIEEAGIVTAAGAVEGLASEPCTMHTYFGTKVKARAALLCLVIRRLHQRVCLHLRFF